MAQVAHKIKEKSRTGDVLISESIDFSGLLLSDPVLKGLQNAGFVRPSPIQLKAIPLGRCGLDLIVQAKSGTGKTCVFSVIALESIATDTASTQVLVLAPTREIAVQIWEVINSIGSAVSGLECHTFIGGLPLQEDRMKLKKCHIAVGSPGRIKQLIESGVLKTDSVRLFVLDEADKLLEESFQEQINWIYSTLPDNKQMVALSATYPEYLASHLTGYMRNPTFLRLNITDPTLLGIRQYQQTVPYHPMAQQVFEHKCKALVNILSSISFQQCLVFSNLQTRAQTLADSLASQGWPTACIAGCLDQKERNEAMAKLKTYKCRILISTDLTSRGIDADKVSLVINLDVPKDHETYLHRIGRAGRFGAFGIAITLVSDGQEKLSLGAIEKRCNTQIFPLPDPLPSDLASAQAPGLLEDVVSTEVINTEGGRGFAADTVEASQQPAGNISQQPTDNEQVVNTSQEPAEPADENGELEDTEAISTNDLTENAAESVKKSASSASTEVFAGLEMKVQASCDKAETRAGQEHEHFVKRQNGYSENENEDLHKQGLVQKAEIECKSVGKLVPNVDSKPVKEKGVEEGEIVPKSSTASLKSLDGSAATDLRRDVSTGFDLNLVHENEGTVKSCSGFGSLPVALAGREPNPEQDLVVKEMKSSNTEMFYVQDTTEMHRQPRVQASKVIFNCEKISLPQIFKQNIGYKPLSNPFTYSDGQKSLRIFLEEKPAIGDKPPQGHVDMPEANLQGEESKQFKTTVDRLQDLFDEHLTVSSHHEDHVVHTESDRKQQSKESQEIVLASQHKLQTDNLPSTEELNTSSQQNASALQSRDGNKIMESQDKEDETIVKDKLKNKSAAVIKQATRKKKAVGFHGKFSIGHMLDVERLKVTDEQETPEIVLNGIDHKTVATIQDSASENVTKNQCYTAEANSQSDQTLWERKYLTEGCNEKTAVSKPSGALFENGHKSIESESESDQVDSEHSESEYTEDSDSDSSNSSSQERISNRHTHRKDQKYNRDSHQSKTHESANIQNVSSPNPHSTWPDWNGHWHEHFRSYGQDGPRHHIHENTRIPQGQSHHQFSPYHCQQYPHHQSSHYPNPMLPWMQYYGYHGYPYLQYSQFTPPSPYYRAPPPASDSTRFNETLESTYSMQAEYIKAMCKHTN